MWTSCCNLTKYKTTTTIKIGSRVFPLDSRQYMHDNKADLVYICIPPILRSEMQNGRNTIFHEDKLARAEPMLIQFL